MALVSIDATDTGWASKGPLDPALLALPQGAAVIVMIHGFRFTPWDDRADPHRHILSQDPRRDCWKAVSWPRHLHLDRAGAGLGIGFGWPARGNLMQVAQRAFGIGRILAEMICHIKALRPDVHLVVMAHSLGARVALAALAELPPGHLQRLILLSGAEYRGVAKPAMASPAGRDVTVLNVTSGENALFDALFRAAVPAPHLTDWPLSAGLPDLPGWTDLRVDCPASLRALRGLGIPTRAPATRICHWSTYLRPGLFRLYRGICDPAQPDLPARLAACLPRPAAQDGGRGPLPRLSPL